MGHFQQIIIKTDCKIHPLVLFGFGICRRGESSFDWNEKHLDWGNSVKRLKSKKGKTFFPVHNFPNSPNGEKFSCLALKPLFESKIL
jgi:hypothetical protein